jgi:putative chitinase
MATTLTGEILKKICPSLSIDRANTIADRIVFCSQAYKFDNNDSLHEFIAQIAHESGEFSIRQENMNYKTPQILMSNWKNHFKTLEFAKQYIGNPEKLANYIYGSTSIAKALGNIKPEDGYAFRGSGFMQLTGRESATKYQKYVGMDSPEHIMQLLRTDDYWATDAACWEFAINKKLIPLSLTNTDESFSSISKRINGGTIGKKERERYYLLAKKYLV